MIIEEYLSRVYQELEELGRVFCYESCVAVELYRADFGVDAAVTRLSEGLADRECTDAMNEAIDSGLIDLGLLTDDV